MSFGGSDSNTNAASTAATIASTSGAQQGNYSNGPVNAPQITGALNAAQDTFQNGTPMTQAGLDAINTGAVGAGDLYKTAQPQLTNTINGDFTSAGNPQFAGLVGQLADAIRPQVDGTFEASGRYGGGADRAAFDSALANKAGDLAYQNYGAERQIQNSDIQNLPSYTAGQFQPGQAELTAGYTPLNQYINQLKTVSPGTAGNFSNTSSSNTNTTGNTSSSGNTVGVTASGGSGKQGSK